MTEQIENIVIRNCPVCGQSHVYSLKIMRSLVMAMSAVDDEAQEVSLTRLFICPTEEIEFQATFALITTMQSPIESVEVFNSEGKSKNG